MKCRSTAARKRADLLHRAEEARRAGREAEAEKLRAEGLALMTCWDRALYALAEHYIAMGRAFYGSYIDHFAAECIRGCGCSRTFRRVVAEFLDLEHRYSPSMNAMVRAARDGTLANLLRNASDGFGDGDAGAVLGSAR